MPSGDVPRKGRTGRLQRPCPARRRPTAGGGSHKTRETPMNTRQTGMHWNDQAISTLRAYWATAILPRRSVVVWASARTPWSARCIASTFPAALSPLRGMSELRAPRAPRPVPDLPRAQPTLPALPSSTSFAIAAPIARPVPLPVSPRPASSSPPLALSFRGSCQWPVGEPRSANFHLCEAPAIAGRPYCEAHCRTAYVRPARTPATASA